MTSGVKEHTIKARYHCVFDHDVGELILVASIGEQARVMTTGKPTALLVAVREYRLSIVQATWSMLNHESNTQQC